VKNLAHLRPDSPFYALFPHGVPILNILVPNVAECIGCGVQEVYMVDLEKLGGEQFEAVARMVHQQCDPSASFDLMKEEIRRHGLPLRSKHVASVTSDSRMFL
jgi:hypothetical protein